MKLKFVEKEKRGFARYCPTFARGYEAMKEGVRRVKVARLVKKLGDKDANVRMKAVWALGNAVVNEKSKDDVLNALGKALGDNDKNVRLNAAAALGYASWKGADITIAISALVKALGDEYLDIRDHSALALGNAIDKGSHETRVAITTAVMEFTNSHEFMFEAEKNSEFFIHTIKAMDRIALKIEELERKAA